MTGLGAAFQTRLKLQNTYCALISLDLTPCSGTVKFCFTASAASVEATGGNPLALSRVRIHHVEIKK
jgi:hypothetical protein